MGGEMNIKSCIKSLLRLEWRIKTYETHSDALRAYKGNYQDEDLVRVILQKTLVMERNLGRDPTAIDPITMQLLYPLSLCDEPPVRVLDFGGACGVHYLRARTVVGDIFDWAIVETTAMVRAAHEMMGLSHPRLRFFERIEDATHDHARPDIVLAIGSIPYTASPSAIIRELAQLGATYIFISRTALSNKGGIYGVQRSKLSENGPGPMPQGFRDRNVYVPIVMLGKDEFEDILTSHGYELIFKATECNFGPMKQYAYLWRGNG